MTTSITVDDREGLIAHIEGLQATLSKRNDRIRQLEEQLAAAEGGEPTAPALRKAYRDGWKAAAARALNGIQEARVALDSVRRPALDTYLAGEHVEQSSPTDRSER